MKFYNTEKIALNESPSEKEGKSLNDAVKFSNVTPLNESPSEKEGKCMYMRSRSPANRTLNESPSEKEGKFNSSALLFYTLFPSMKVPPKRKGNKVQVKESDRDHDPQ